MCSREIREPLQGDRECSEKGEGGGPRRTIGGGPRGALTLRAAVEGEWWRRWSWRWRSRVGERVSKRGVWYQGGTNGWVKVTSNYLRV